MATNTRIILTSTGTSSEKLLLLAIYDHCDYRTASGGYVSITSLSKLTGLSLATVKRCLVDLRKRGWVAWVKGESKSATANLYTVNIESITQAHHEPRSPRKKPATQAHHEPTQAHHEPRSAQNKLHTQAHHEPRPRLIDAPTQAHHEPPSSKSIFKDLSSTHAPGSRAPNAHARPIDPLYPHIRCPTAEELQAMTREEGEILARSIIAEMRTKPRAN